MTDYRPRPDDHLVEPLFEGLAEAHEERPGERDRPTRRARGLVLLFWIVVTILTGGLLFVLP